MIQDCEFSKALNSVGSKRSSLRQEQETRGKSDNLGLIYPNSRGKPKSKQRITTKTVLHQQLCLEIIYLLFTKNTEVLQLLLALRV